MTTTSLRVAAGQAAAAPGDLDANVRTTARLAALAGDQGVRVLVLPEAFLTGYEPAVFGGDLPGPADLTGPRLDPVREQARRTDLTVVVGTALDRGARRTLSTVVVRPDGEVVVAYDKQHVDLDERAWFEPGDHGASVLVDGVELGLSTCYDGCFPEHARAASDAGALGYLCSAAYFPGGAHRRDLYYAARALDNGFYVVLSGLTGRCGDSSFIGGSAVYDPEGRPLARLGEEEGLAVAELDPGLVLATRERHRMHHDHRGDLGTRVRV
ncbi:putative amidohydrolase [Nocardioides marinisabuli]|uniref:Putative amidohydrolase n=1 Tax=Nocardioides marinisabuli TaxID=419476 RepID=A0A7Y9JNS9_9ACTN|nr:carbon-nitrogen hydrolase family protein [Nocardioides marinisabuli]NYD56167.1 putative amidohydrolase [Nocardioides marinisabuli]